MQANISSSRYNFAHSFLLMCTLSTLIGCSPNAQDCSIDLKLDALETNQIAQFDGCLATVTGTVLQVYRGKNGKVTYINFSPNYKKDFSGVMFQTGAQRLADAGINLDNLVGKNISINGVVSVYKPHFYSQGKPQIVINKVNQIVY